MIIGVAGAGTMGTAIAQAFAEIEGYQVVLSDFESREHVQAGRAAIAARLQKMVDRGSMPQAGMADILDRISTGLYDSLKDCDLVIDSVIEKMDAKVDLFKQLQGICRKDTIFASNTSALSLTEMAKGLDRSVIGMHFFNPVSKMKLVEIVAGLNTPPELVERVCCIAREIGKTPVIVKESTGFVVNRILVPMINEGIQLLYEGVATAKDIDTAMKLGANHPMGPLELGDLIGLDICLDIMETLHRETGDSKYRPHPYLKSMVRGGLLGRKSGRGFYDYR